MSKITEGGAGIGRVTSIRSGRKTVSGTARSLATAPPHLSWVRQRARANRGTPHPGPRTASAPSLGMLTRSPQPTPISCRNPLGEPGPGWRVTVKLLKSPTRRDDRRRTRPRGLGCQVAGSTPTAHGSRAQPSTCHSTVQPSSPGERLRAKSPHLLGASLGRGDIRRRRVASRRAQPQLRRMDITAGVMFVNVTRAPISRRHDQALG